jgi:acyl-CoA synthetase (AMP-forming)/AMP-acid ligase II
MMPAQNYPLVLTDMTERAAAATPDRIALVCEGQRLRCAELHDLVLRCAAALKSLGIGAGDRLGYLGLNSIDYAILMQAAFRLGAVPVPINWRLTPSEIGYIVADSEFAFVLTSSELLTSLATDAPTLLMDAGHGGQPAFQYWIQSFAPDPAVAPVTADSIALQLYTSGTTGHPKGALLTHGSLSCAFAQGSVMGESWCGWQDDDVGLIAMPQFHIAGTGWTLQAMNAGVTGVILPRPEVEAMIDAIEQERATKVFAVPAVLAMILAHPRSATADFSSVRLMAYGASPIPLYTLKRSIALFPNAQFVQMYGATETSGTVTYLPPEDHHPDGTPRMAGCGKPFPSVEVRIMGADGGPAAPHQIGEVLIRSPQVMQGYHKLDGATASAMADGWYRTGDAGYLDEDGYLYLYDRVKDMIVSGGENIYPAEVENVLHDHPAVRDCAVIAVPDARWGEAVKAIVVCAPGERVEPDALIAFVRERIAGYKVPKSIDFADALPRNPSGKILKKELRRPYWPDGERQIG